MVTCVAGRRRRVMAGYSGAEKVVVGPPVLPVHRHVNDGVDARRKVNENVTDQMSICVRMVTINDRSR